MRIGVIGAGRIGGNAARLFAKAGHEVLVSFSRDPQKLEALAAEIGGRAGTPREAVAFGEVVMLSVSWTLIDDVLAQAGSLDAKIVIDTTNQFGREGWEDLGGRTAAQVNAARMPGARYTKAFNTLTSGFQAAGGGAHRTRPRGDVPVRRRRGGQARRRRAHRRRRLHAGRHGRHGRCGADGGAAARGRRVRRGGP